MSFWDLISYILGGAALIAVAVLFFLCGPVPIFTRCKRLFRGDVDAQVWKVDKEMLRRFGNVGSVVYIVFDTLLASFFTVLPMHIMGVYWAFSALLAMATMGAKILVDGAGVGSISDLIVTGVQLFLGVKVLGYVVNKPVSTLSIVYYVTAAIFIITRIIPIIVVFVRSYIERKA